jgi:DNA-binding Lrp family transcriptional regulator
MAIAYVLINSEVGKEHDVIEQLKKMDSVKEINYVYGVYDIVTKVETKDINDLKSAVIAEIRKLDYVKSTLTMIVMGG